MRRDMWQVTHDKWHMTHNTIWHMTGGRRWVRLLLKLQLPRSYSLVVTGDMWHLTCDTWHVTCDTWHLTYDTWYVSNDTWDVTNDGRWTFSQNVTFLALEQNSHQWFLYFSHLNPYCIYSNFNTALKTTLWHFTELCRSVPHIQLFEMVKFTYESRKTD